MTGLAERPKMRAPGLGSRRWRWPGRPRPLPGALLSSGWGARWT